MTRLGIGDVIELADGSRYEVTLVNQSRARVKALRRDRRSGVAYNPATGKTDKHFSFNAPARELDISPCASVKIIKRGQSRGLTYDQWEARKAVERKERAAAEIKNKQQTKAEEKTNMKNEKKNTKTVAVEKPAAKKAAKQTTKSNGSTPMISKNEHGKELLFGFPVTAVCRTLGKLNWSPTDAVTAITHVFKHVSPSTVKIQVGAGKRGERGEPAALTEKQIAQLRDAIPTDAKAPERPSVKDLQKSVDQVTAEKQPKKATKKVAKAAKS